MYEKGEFAGPADPPLPNKDIVSGPGAFVSKPRGKNKWYLRK